MSTEAATKVLRLEIELGNEAMQTADDLARALRNTAERLERGHDEGGIVDANGNTVGEWSVGEYR